VNYSGIVDIGVRFLCRKRHSQKKSTCDTPVEGSKMMVPRKGAILQSEVDIGRFDTGSSANQKRTPVHRPQRIEITDDGP
jgi:hypothetical protein